MKHGGKMPILKRFKPTINLRFKAHISLGCYIFGILSMTLVAQNDLLTARDKLATLEQAYGLETIILEIRRYEKNFLLYGTWEALEENHKQVELALNQLDLFNDHVRQLKAYPLLVRIGISLRSYKTGIEQLTALHQQKQVEAIKIVEEAIRIDGQEMTELCENLVSFEHKQINKILAELTGQPIFWSTLTILVGLFIPLFMFVKIFKPLAIIKKATEDIASGRFRKIEVIDTRDEMQQVIEAFNTMVGELQKRQDQLVQSQKLVSIGTLSAGIAHQLNNPLNNISTSCQIAISDFDDGDKEFIKKMLSNIDQETARARDVVQGLLEFSREKDFALRMLNLATIASRSVKLVHSQIPAPIKITVDIAPELVLPMDGQRIQEVFLNLIINASHAISGAGTIDISASVHDEEDMVYITVCDSGCGISRDIQKRLFDPFFSTKEEGKGTGLGLSIAYGIIQKHNGKIWVSSEIGEGTTFHIELPLHMDTIS